jgi:hypothetical protein
LAGCKVSAVDRTDEADFTAVPLADGAATPLFREGSGILIGCFLVKVSSKALASYRPTRKL